MESQLLAKYYFNELRLKKAGNDVDRIGMTLFNSKIRLTPHQIKAALFSFNSPVSKGVILADEVGLGKTIEAGIIIAQKWFEKKSRILIISPASLMRQWNSELYDKFQLPSMIMDRKTYNSKLKDGIINPFSSKENIIICSYQFASIMKDEISKSNFEMVIIDEAHKLRNVYNEKSITSNNIKFAVKDMKKVLLTATPIQNNLMDIYGLVSFIDDNIFGDAKIFKLNYMKNFNENKGDLKYRLLRVVNRTLRNEVQPYIKFTKRLPKTFTFTQTQEEQEIYNAIRSILLDTEGFKYIIPQQQRHLLVLILSKLMGSSLSALEKTLTTIKQRLLKMKEQGIVIENKHVIEEVELLTEELEYINEKINKDEEKEEEKLNLVQLEKEILFIDKILNNIQKIDKESKFYALLESLEYSFEHLKNIEANEKVIIFTESKQTQKYLFELLVREGYEDIFLYNGTNTDDISKEIYKEWISNPVNKDKLNNSKNINMRSAIIEKFKKEGKILITTEAGAEGLNLQFASLVINYDLPWNPQRVEQRIGRAHRFGQKHDVVVINFINSNNKVEQRVFELLSNKFNLFNEIFGASDEILGKLEDSMDIEKSIVNIYTTCRTPEEIDEAFNKLQQQYQEEIDKTLKKTREELLNNFEEDIQNYFEETLQETKNRISDIEDIFWNLTKIILKDQACFDDNEYSFEIKNGDFSGIYKLSSRNMDDEYIDFNLNTVLGTKVMEIASNIHHEYGHINFDVSNYKFKLSQVEALKGNKGLISLNKLKIESFEDEEYLFFTGITEDNNRLDNELCRRIFRVLGNEKLLDKIIDDQLENLNKDIYQNSKSFILKSQDKNNTILTNEINKINLWADDKIQGIQLNVENMRNQRKELQKQSDIATNSLDKERLENEIINISRKIKNSWFELAELEDIVEGDRKKMIDSIRKEHNKKTVLETIFTISFEVI